MDIPILAASAVALLTPYLVKGSEEFAKKVGGVAFENVVKLLALVKEKLISKAAKGTIEDLEAAPGIEDNQNALCIQLKKALEIDSDFAEELKARIKNIEASGGAAVKQIIDASGDRNKFSQISGSHNIVNM